MSALVFVDTNVFIYAMDYANPKKQKAAQAWRADLWHRRRGRTSFQVLQEFYAKVTQKWPSASREAQSEIRDLLTWQPVIVDDAILEQAWKIQDRYRLSFLGFAHRSRRKSRLLSLSSYRGFAAR